jgi:hypothetical protein
MIFIAKDRVQMSKDMHRGLLLLTCYQRNPE